MSERKFNAREDSEQRLPAVSGKKRLARQNSKHTPFEQEVAFWVKVRSHKGGCWEWTHATDADGYGRFRHDAAHRWLWQLVNGPIPEGMYLCHHCDNPPCVRPSHLFIGTAQDNANDMLRKGRSSAGKPSKTLVLGERCAKSKLTENKVREIRQAVAAGLATQAELAARYGVDPSAISCVVRRVTWGHVV